MAFNPRFLSPDDRALPARPMVVPNPRLAAAAMVAAKLASMVGPPQQARQAPPPFDPVAAANAARGMAPMPGMYGRPPAPLPPPRPELTMQGNAPGRASMGGEGPGGMGNPNYLERRTGHRVGERGSTYVSTNTYPLNPNAPPPPRPLTTPPGMYGRPPGSTSNEPVAYDPTTMTVDPATGMPIGQGDYGAYPEFGYQADPTPPNRARPETPATRLAREGQAPVAIGSGEGAAQRGQGLTPGQTGQQESDNALVAYQVLAGQGMALDQAAAQATANPQPAIDQALMPTLATEQDQAQAAFDAANAEAAAYHAYAEGSGAVGQQLVEDALTARLGRAPTDDEFIAETERIQRESADPALVLAADERRDQAYAMYYQANSAVGYFGGEMNQLPFPSDASWIFWGLDASRQASVTQVGGAIYDYATGNTDSPRAAALFGGVNGAPANEALGWVSDLVGFGPGDIQSWADGHKQEVFDAFTNGYNGYTGERAVWELFVADQNDAQKIAYDVLLDPLNYLAALGVGGKAIRTAGTAQREAATTIGGRVAGGAREVIGRALEAPTALLDKPVDAVVGGIASGIRHVTGGFFRPTRQAVVRERIGDLGDVVTGATTRGSSDIGGPTTTAGTPPAGTAPTTGAAPPTVPPTGRTTTRSGRTVVQSRDAGGRTVWQDTDGWRVVEVQTPRGPAYTILKPDGTVAGTGYRSSGEAWQAIDAGPGAFGGTPSPGTRQPPPKPGQPQAPSGAIVSNPTTLANQPPVGASPGPPLLPGAGQVPAPPPGSVAAALNSALLSPSSGQPRSRYAPGGGRNVAAAPTPPPTPAAPTTAQPRSRYGPGAAATPPPVEGVSNDLGPTPGGRSMTDLGGDDGIVVRDPSGRTATITVGDDGRQLVVRGEDGTEIPVRDMDEARTVADTMLDRPVGETPSPTAQEAATTPEPAPTTPEPTPAETPPDAPYKVPVRLPREEFTTGSGIVGTPPTTRLARESGTFDWRTAPPRIGDELNDTPWPLRPRELPTSRTGNPRLGQVAREAPQAWPRIMADVGDEGARLERVMNEANLGTSRDLNPTDAAITELRFRANVEDSIAFHAPEVGPDPSQGIRARRQKGELRRINLLTGTEPGARAVPIAGGDAEAVVLRPWSETGGRWKRGQPPATLVGTRQRLHMTGVFETDPTKVAANPVGVRRYIEAVDLHARMVPADLADPAFTADVVDAGLLADALRRAGEPVPETRVVGRGSAAGASVATTGADLPSLAPDHVRLVHLTSRQAVDAIRREGLDYSRQGMIDSTARAYSNPADVRLFSDDPRFSGPDTVAVVFDVPTDEYRLHRQVGSAPGVVSPRRLVGVVEQPADALRRAGEPVPETTVVGTRLPTPEIGGITPDVTIPPISAMTPSGPQVVPPGTEGARRPTPMRGGLRAVGTESSNVTTIRPGGPPSWIDQALSRPRALQPADPRIPTDAPREVDGLWLSPAEPATDATPFGEAADLRHIYAGLGPDDRTVRIVAYDRLPGEDPGPTRYNLEHRAEDGRWVSMEIGKDFDLALSEARRRAVQLDQAEALAADEADRLDAVATGRTTRRGSAVPPTAPTAADAPPAPLPSPVTRTPRAPRAPQGARWASAEDVPIKEENKGRRVVVGDRQTQFIADRERPGVRTWQAWERVRDGNAEGIGAHLLIKEVSKDEAVLAAREAALRARQGAPDAAPLEQIGPPPGALPGYGPNIPGALRDYFTRPVTPTAPAGITINDAPIERWRGAVVTQADADVLNTPLSTGERAGDYVSRRLDEELAKADPNGTMAASLSGESARTVIERESLPGIMRDLLETELKAAEIDNKLLNGLLQIWDGFTAPLRRMQLLGPATMLRYIFTQFIGNPISLMLARNPEAAIKSFDPRTTWQMFKWIRGEGDLPTAVAEKLARMKTGNVPHGVMQLARDELGQVTDRELHNLSRRIGLDALSPLETAAKALLAPKWAQQMARAADLAARLTLWDTEMNRLLPIAAKSLGESAGERATRLGLDDALVRNLIEGMWPMVDPTVLRNAMRDEAIKAGRTINEAHTFADRIERDWLDAQRTASHEATSEVKRVLFGGAETNFDAVARRFFFFHYWNSRASILYAKEMIRSPGVANAYFRGMEEIKERAEENGAPPWLRTWIEVFDSPFGMSVYLNGYALITTQFLMKEGGEEEAWWRQFVPMLNPAIDMAAYVIGADGFREFMTGRSSDSPPSLPGISAIDRVITAGVNVGRAFLGDDMGPVFGPTRGLLPGLRDAVPGNEPTGNVNATTQSTLNTFIADAAEAMGYTTEQTIAAMSNTSDPAYQEGFENWSLATAGTEAWRSTVPVPIQTRGETRDELIAENRYLGRAGQDAYQSVFGTEMPEGYNPYADGVSPQDEAFLAAYEDEVGTRPTEEQVTAAWVEPESDQAVYQAANATDEGRALEAEITGAEAVGTEAGRTARDTWNAIAYGDDREALGESGEITIGGRTYDMYYLVYLPDETREGLANQWAIERGYDDDVAAQKELDAAYKAQHPNYVAFKDWQDEVYDASGGPLGWWEFTAQTNPAAAAYLAEQQARGLTSTQLAGALGSPDAYLAYRGIEAGVFDTPLPEATGAGVTPPAAAPPPADPVQSITDEVTGFRASVQAANYILIINGIPPTVFEYGTDAEQAAARTVLAQYGMTVPVLSSDAKAYVRWAGAQPPGADRGIPAFLSWQTSAEAMGAGIMAPSYLDILSGGGGDPLDAFLNGELGPYSPLWEDSPLDIPGNTYGYGAGGPPNIGTRLARPQFNAGPSGPLFGGYGTRLPR